MHAPIRISPFRPVPRAYVKDTHTLQLTNRSPQGTVSSAKLWAVHIANSFFISFSA